MIWQAGVLRQVILFIFLCAISSCQATAPQPVAEKPVSSSSPMPSASASPAFVWPDPYDINPKVSTGNTYVEALESKLSSPQLRYPMDLAVSKDGATVYVLNRNCGSSDRDYVSRPFSGERYWFTFRNQSSPLENQIVPDCHFDGLSQKLIYTVSSQGKLGVLTIKGLVPFPFQLGEDVETDQDSNLYFAVPDTHRIYKFNPSNQDLQVVTQVLNYVPVEDYVLLTAREKFAVQQVSERTKIGLLEGPVRLQVSSAGLFYFVGSLSTPSFSFAVERYDYLSQRRTIVEQNFERPALPVYVVQPEGGLEVTGYIPYDYEDIPNPEYLHSVSVRNSKGQIFGNDVKRSQIWKWDPESQMRVPFAGSGEDGFKDGTGLDASFRYPMGLAFDGQDNLYVSDTGNHAIRKITPEGQVTTIYKEKPEIKQ